MIFTISLTLLAPSTASVLQAQPSLLQLLTKHPSVRPPLAALLDALPPLAPRLYSLCCAPAEFPEQAHVAFSVVKYTPPFAKTLKEGVATNWLDRVYGPQVKPPPRERNSPPREENSPPREEFAPERGEFAPERGEFAPERGEFPTKNI
eukprot:9368486-Pyramimonas_sp.AAC.2